MGYDIEFTTDAERILGKLARSNREMARRITRELVALGAGEAPRRFLSQLEGHLLGRRHRLELDQEIDIAAGLESGADGRPEEGEVFGAVSAAERDQGLEDVIRDYRNTGRLLHLSPFHCRYRTRGKNPLPRPPTVCIEACGCCGNTIGGGSGRSDDREGNFRPEQNL